jgi:hypothetical protein
VSDPSPVIPTDARPRLPRGVRLVHNEAQGGWVLLAPERVFKADAIAVEIVKRWPTSARCCAGSPTSGCWNCSIIPPARPPSAGMTNDRTTVTWRPRMRQHCTAPSACSPS